MKTLEEQNRFIRFAMGTERLEKALQRYKNKKLEPYNLHSMHLMLLFALYINGQGMTCTEIAEVCSVDKSHVSRISKELRNKGYVELHRTEKYVDRCRMCLSANGVDLMKEIDSMIDDMITEATEGVSDNEIKVFYQVLNRIGSNLEQMAEAE